jgi:glutamine kinase
MSAASSPEQIIILGAGRPHRGDVPAALRTDREGTSVLEWMVDALNVTLDDVTFVGGFEVDAIRKRYPRLRVIVPSEWRTTGSAASLLAVPLEVARPAIVVYSDILVRPALVEVVRASTADVTFALDSCWRERFAGRRRAVLAGREKVVVGAGVVERLGVDIEVDDASGEFIGLVRLSSGAVETVDRLRSVMEHPDLRRAHLSGLLQVVRDRGVDVDGIDVAGDWAEVDEPADIARFVLGTKADTLARLRRLVGSARIADQVTRTVEDWERAPQRAVAAVMEAFGDRPLIVRSSTTHEDAFSASNAGGFTSVLGVRASAGLLDAVGEVAGSYRRAGIDADVQQVLVQPLIDDVAVSGVALTRTLDHGAPWLVVEYTTDGDTEAVTSGTSGDLRTLVIRRDLDPRSGAAASASGELSRVAPLLTALMEVEGLLGHDGLDVEFAIDRAGTVHLLQVRPAVTATEVAGRRPERDALFATALADAHATWRHHADPAPHLPGAARAMFGIMPDWNPAEIVGTAPGRLALDLYRRLITDEVWAQQRAEAGYRDVRPAPLLVTFAGRPYVDVRASFASFLPAGLDDALAGRLLAGALDRLAARPELHDKVEFAVVPTCLDPDWQRWEEVLRHDGLVPGEVEDLRRALATVTANVLGRVDGDLVTVRELAQRTAARTVGVVDPLVRAVILLDEAQRSGTLPFAHLARAAFVAVSLLRGAQAQGVLSAEAVADFHASIRTVSHDLSADAQAVAAGGLGWDDLVGRWGHLRPGTYEVTSARYDADPDRFLRPLVDAPAAAVDHDDRPAGDGRVAGAWRAERAGFLNVLDRLGLGGDHEAVERTLRGAIEGREWAKLAFTRNLSDALELVAAAWAERGVDRGVIADVPLELLLPGPDGGVTDVAVVRERAEQGRRERELSEAFQLPPLLCVEADLDVFVLSADTPNFVGTRPVIAPVLVLDGGAVPIPDVRGRIVLIPRADPGFDWLFGHGLAGLVTLYGGANSHMAIRAAEFGLPAAIGVGEQRFRTLMSADQVELDPRGHTLRALR